MESGSTRSPQDLSIQPWRKLSTLPEIRAAYYDAIPLNRYGLEHELAEAILFLCSDRASYITGQTIAVHGGFEATGIGLRALRANEHTELSAGKDQPSQPRR